MRLEALALEGGLSETENTRALAFGNDPAETLLDQGPQRRALAGCQSPGFVQESVGNLYGCLHIAICITAYIELSSAFYFPK
jgi:hypothetical protein